MYSSENRKPRNNKLRIRKSKLKIRKDKLKIRIKSTNLKKN